jgi:hypothetical protein
MAQGNSNTSASILEQLQNISIASADVPSSKIPLPPRGMTKCDNCSNTKNLRLCSKCGEGIYCSAACQSSLWPHHKRQCKLTDRIDLATFYPFLAGLADCSHLFYNVKPMHQAVTHQIINSPNPYTSATVLSKELAAKAIVLGDPIRVPFEISSKKWWPTASSDMVRSKLFRRISREGYVLPILTSLCTALLASFYPEGPVDSKEPRCRLRYRSSVISDFGIAKGWADVKPQDRFVYFFRNDQKLEMGQDPKEHYWIYFRTVRGEEVTLDLSMFTFNLCMQVTLAPYFPQSFLEMMPAYSPAFFADRVIQAGTPNLHYEVKRASILHNDKLREALSSSPGCNEDSEALMVDFMEQLSGRPITPQEQDAVAICTERHLETFSWLVKGRYYRCFPSEVALSIEQDPGEVSDPDPEKEDEWNKQIKEFKRLKKKGRAPETSIALAFQQWKEREGKAKSI